MLIHILKKTAQYEENHEYNIMEMRKLDSLKMHI